MKWVKQLRFIKKLQSQVSDKPSLISRWVKLWRICRDAAVLSRPGGKSVVAWQEMLRRDGLVWTSVRVQPVSTIFQYEKWYISGRENSSRGIQSEEIELIQKTRIILPRPDENEGCRSNSERLFAWDVVLATIVLHRCLSALFEIRIQHKKN
jgi:hypothetical protein